MGDFAVELSGVNKVFTARRSEVVALADVDLTVGRGEFVALIGPSGCGKSTLLRVIADLIAPTSGQVAVNGKSPRQARMDQDYGFAFQQAGLLDWRTVRANIELPLALTATTVRWHAAARGHCPGAGRTPGVTADGRAVRCPR
jgi:NitT/TauT family transport system ATP-binding protein